MSYEQKHGVALGQLLELTLLMNDDMDHGLAAMGLTTSRAHLLWELHQRGPSTQRVLADAIGVSPRNITGLVDALVATGFVTREPHPGDRRAALVTFTTHGAAIAKELEAGQQDFAETLFAELPPDLFDCFVQGLDQVLGRFRDRLDAEGRGHPGG